MKTKFEIIVLTLFVFVAFGLCLNIGPLYSAPSNLTVNNLTAQGTVSGVTVSGTTVTAVNYVGLPTDMTVDNLTAVETVSGVTISGTTFVGLPIKAPVNATFWTSTSDSVLTDEVNIQDLMSGVTDAFGILALYRYGTYFTPVFKDMTPVPTGLIKFQNNGIFSMDIVPSVPGTDYVFMSGTTPATSDSSGVTGQVETDSDYFYYYIGSEWKRVAFSGVTW